MPPVGTTIMTSHNSPFGFLWRFLPSSGSDLIEQVAGEVARACRANLWHQISRGTLNMSVAEVRGYVRAYASRHVRAEAEQARSRRHLRRSQLQPLIEAATAQLVAMITRDVLSDASLLRPDTIAA